MLVLEHEHCKLIEELIIDCIQNITAPLAAVGSAENVIDKAEFVFKFQIDAVLFKNCFLNRTEFGFCDLNTKFFVFNKVERNDIAVTDTSKNFRALDFVIKIVLDDLNELLRNFLVRTARRYFRCTKIGSKDNDAFAEIYCFALTIGKSAIFKYLKKNVKNTGIRLCRFFNFVK